MVQKKVTPGLISQLLETGKEQCHWMGWGRVGDAPGRLENPGVGGMEVKCVFHSFKKDV